MPQPKRPGRNDAEWTADDYLASRNLRTLWDRKARKINLSQNKFANRWGISQGATSRYINGILRLNPEAVLKFATSLEVDPLQIDPRLGELVKTKKNEYIHSIKVKTTDFEPRIFQGDWITLDTLNKPKANRLVCAHNNHILLIGRYKPDTHELIHPITQLTLPIPPGVMLHNIQAIIPEGL